ncbi:bifunctional 5,10-methylenetetrahydrofolate dehydrogenase/5,10-methenyltetrahydrofolate cyclohydrolase [Bacillota bacterium]
MLLKGKPVADKIKEEIVAAIEKRREAGEVPPKVALVRVGENPDDMAYEGRIVKNCLDLGFVAETVLISGGVSTEELITALRRLNADAGVHGILLFRPLPPQFDVKAVSKEIKAEKDIDSMSPVNLAKVTAGDKSALAPCTPEAVVELLRHYYGDLGGKNIVVVNRSLVLGKPLAMLLLSENATVTLCHSKSENLPDITSRADIVVTGVGKAKFFGSEFFSEKSIVIDVGINFQDGKMCGDVDTEAVEPKVRDISPVPGGVGTVTSMILLRNALKGMRLQEAENNG